ncbi:MAG: hypothetical protein C4536_02765 [Actinobacteria bacterium]|nr:MAG: hypothetical protein C4536_02765 [Actinomycetota bacterium]
MRNNRVSLLLIGLVIISMLALSAAAFLGGCGKGKSSLWGDGQDGNGGNGQDGTHAEGFAGIAFVRGGQIYLADPDTQDVRRLTTQDAAYANLAFSPDASKLSATMVVSDSMPQLVIIDVESGKMTDVSWTNEDYSGAWTAADVQPWFGSMAWADEDTLYATAARITPDWLYPRVIEFDLSGPGIKVIADKAQNPSLSPDGRKLAYVRQPEEWRDAYGGLHWEDIDPGDLVIQDLGSGDIQKIEVTSQGAYRGYIYAAVFSPDGKHLAAVCSDEPDTALYYADLEGAVDYAIEFVGPQSKVGSPSFSPDGAWIAYHLSLNDGTGGPLSYSISVAPTGVGGNPEVIQAGEGSYPAWSPVPFSGEEPDWEWMGGAEEETDGGGDETAAVEAAMLAFVKENAMPGLEFEIVNLKINGDEAVGVAVCTNEEVDSPLVIMKKGPGGWEGVDVGTGIDAPSWYE